jgi:large subunit ribosomal protein L17
MRHGDKINNLGRTASHRKALLRNMSIALIEHKRITTTLAKAKALRRHIEPLLTKAKTNTTHSRRMAFSLLQNKEAVKELFGTVAARIGERPGGYVRVIRLGFRRGDGAETAMIELVDFNEVYNPNAGKVRQQKKTRRGGGAVKKASESAVADTPGQVDPIVEDVVAAADQNIEDRAADVQDADEASAAEKA